MLYIAKQESQMIYGCQHEITAPNGYGIAKKKLMAFPKGYRLVKTEFGFNMPSYVKGTVLSDGNNIKKVIQSNLFCGDFITFLECYSPIYEIAFDILENSFSKYSVKLKDLLPSNQALALHLRRITYLLNHPDFGANYILETYPDFGVFCVMLPYMKLHIKEMIPFVDAKDRIMTGSENEEILKLALDCHPSLFPDA